MREGIIGSVNLYLAIYLSLWGWLIADYHSKKNHQTQEPDVSHKILAESGGFMLLFGLLFLLVTLMNGIGLIYLLFVTLLLALWASQSNTQLIKNSVSEQQTICRPDHSKTLVDSIKIELPYLLKSAQITLVTAGIPILFVCCALIIPAFSPTSIFVPLQPSPVVLQTNCSENQVNFTLEIINFQDSPMYVALYTGVDQTGLINPINLTTTISQKDKWILPTQSLAKNQNSTFLYVMTNFGVYPVPLNCNRINLYGSSRVN